MRLAPFVLLFQRDGLVLLLPLHLTNNLPLLHTLCLHLPLFIWRLIFFISILFTFLLVHMITFFKIAFSPHPKGGVLVF